MKHFTKHYLIVLAFLLIPLFSEAQITGEVNVGAGGNYSTLGAFANALNSQGMSGNTTVYIISNIEETNDVVINQWTEIGSGGYYLTIKPNGANRTIQGNCPSSAVIVLNGADRVIIDGEYNTGERNLTIKNTSIGGYNAAIYVKGLNNGQQGCNNVTIKNTNIIGSYSNWENSGNYGIYSASGDFISSIWGVGADNDNLTIQNNSIKKAYTGIFVKGLFSGNNRLDSLKIEGNSIGSDNMNEYICGYGINVDYVRAPNISGNDIFNIVVGCGINLQYAQASTISKNHIFNIGSYSEYDSPIGINVLESCGASLISCNTIHNIKTSIGWVGAYGINIGNYFSYDGGNNDIKIINNVIYNIRTANYTWMSYETNPFGIRLCDGTGHQILFNSINLYGEQNEGQSASMTACLISVSENINQLDIRNNVFSNSLTGNEGTLSYAIYIAGSSSVFSNINNNDYYVSGENGVLGFLNNNLATLIEWQAATSQDINSISLEPMFTAADDLFPSNGSPLISAGQYISTVLTDILGNPRYSPCSIGAYDLLPVGLMQYETSIVSQDLDEYVMAGAEDQSIIKIIINTSGSENPISVTNFFLNSNGTTNSADVTEAKLFYTGSNYNFSTEYQFGETINNISNPFQITGNQILYPGDNYFWLTYSISENATQMNLVDAECTSITCNGIARIPTITAPTGSCIIRSRMNGTYTVGASGFYANLNEAIADIQLLGLSGDVTLSIISDITEESPVVIYPWTEYGNGSYYIKISPANGNRTIQGDFSDNGVIILNNADRVIIDGELIPGERNLSIINNATTGTNCVIRLIGASANNGCNNVIIRNCVLSNGNFSNSTSIGIALGGDILGTQNTGYDNDNITIENNLIKNVYYGIFAFGDQMANNNNLKILNNEIGYPETTGSIGLMGIAVLYCPDAIIEGNHIYNIGWINATSSQAMGIYINYGSNNAIIRNNRIHSIWNIYPTNYSGAFGINIISSSGILIANNEIFDIVTTNYNNSNTNYNPFGIRIMNNSNDIKIFNNSINLYGIQQPNSNYENGSLSSCILISNSLRLDIRNNVFSNTLQGLAGSNPICVAFLGNISFYSMNYNDFYYVLPDGKFGYYVNQWANTLTLWQNGLSLDLNSMEAFPNFTSDNNLFPLESSPLIAAGTYINNNPYDLLGNQRPLNPTIGAYEFNYVVKLISPEYNSNNISLMPFFEWEEHGNATNYNIQIATNYDFSNIIFEGSNILNNYYQIGSSNQLESNTEYFWRVLAVVPNGSNFWSNTWKFTTQYLPWYVYTNTGNSLQSSFLPQLTQCSATVHLHLVMQ